MTADRGWFFAAFAASGLFAAFAIRYGYFAAGISDGSGYVSEAMRWLSGELFGPFPFAWLSPPLNPEWFMPLAYREGPSAGSDVFVCMPGLPLLMAPMIAAFGELGAYFVPPLLGGLLVWTTGDLAAMLAGPRARALAALLMATCAIALFTAHAPMSDVPAAALWSLSMVLALRPGQGAAAASGLVVTMAVLTRANLAPLAVCPAALLLAAGVTFSSSKRRLLVFGCAAAVGPLLMLWLQTLAYGSPFASGYEGIEEQFAWKHVAANVSRYFGWYAASHTWLALAAGLAPVLVLRRGCDLRSPEGRLRAALTGALAVQAVLVWVLYLPYTPYQDWPFLRFMLPALPAVYALTAAVCVRAVSGLPARLQLVSVLGVMALAGGEQAWRAYRLDLHEHWQWNRRIFTSGRYLEAALPRDAVVVSFYHSGSTRHYSGRPILRPDLIAPEQLDIALDALRQHGFSPYLLLDRDLERAAYLAKFASSRYGKLDWPPRAEIGHAGRIDLYDPADRERFLQGQRWPVDRLP